jgi:DNA-directed RNA polymerase specialized sigma24 family protein
VLKPLTGTYTRPDGVRQEIEEVLKHPLPVAFRMAAEGKLKPQTLVYLMRNFRPNQRTRDHDNLVVAFLSRLERFGDRLIRDFSEVDREKINGEVMNIVLELINDDKLDIFEMSFKRGATCLYLTARAKVRLRAQTEVSREDLVLPESDMTGEETADALSFVQDGTLPLAEARAMLRQVRDKLKEREWLALLYVDGMDLTDKEAGEQMNCSARNIQYLLTKARKKVRGEERGARPNTRAKVKS